MKKKTNGIEVINLSKQHLEVASPISMDHKNLTQKSTSKKAISSLGENLKKKQDVKLDYRILRST